MHNISALQMDGENLFSNTECWKDHFLADNEEFSNDKLPPEVKTYCKVVDGISKKNGLNILVVPICAPENDEYTEQKGIKQSFGGGVNGGDGGEGENMDKLIEKRKKNDYYKLVNEKYKELCNEKKSFGVIYVYHNKYCIKHCDGFVYHKNKDDIYEYFSSFEHDIKFPLPIGCAEKKKHSTQHRQFYFSEKNFYRDYFSCRTVALQFIISLLKDDCKSIKGLNDNLICDNYDPFFSLPEDFIKYAQVNIELLARLLCIFDKIRENKCQLDKNEDLLYEPAYYLTKYSDNNELKQKLSEKIKQFNISDEEIKQKTDMLEKDVYRQNADGKWCNVGLAKLGAEWYARYADKKFLEEHNDIIKKYNQKHNITNNSNNYDSAAYDWENLKKPDRNGALATIDETYNKIMEQKKNGKNQQSTQNNNTNSKDSDNKINGKANNEDDKSSMIMKNDNNDKKLGEDSGMVSIKVGDGVKNGTVNSSKDGENITFSCPFFNCFSCNGCAVFNNEKQNEVNFRQNT